MASEIRIREQVQAGAAERERRRKKFEAEKKARRQASQIAKNKQRLKDAKARLNALMNPKSAKDRKESKTNLGEIRRLKAFIAALQTRLGLKKEAPKKETSKSTGSPVAPERGKGVDDAGPVGQEARRDKSKDKKSKLKKVESKKKETTKEAKSKKMSGVRKSDMMGGNEGSMMPLGAEKEKKKKKPTLMGRDPYGTRIYKGRKINYGQR
tara:strand:+ start:222 stop:851 length:630 start_codon:yes stop_codon:yes gene_type:complete